MAHLLFDTLSGVTVDNQTTLTVQSLLDSQSLPNEAIPGASVVATRPPTAITLDEEDVFQCGKCKKQFTSFTLFMCHKKEHAVAEEQEHQQQQLPGSQIKQTVQGSLTLSLDGVQQDSDNRSVSYSQALQDREAEVGQPIILSDSDILSFNIDGGALNITSGSHVLPPLSHVIQNGTFLASPSESGSSLKSGSLNVTTLEGQPIILSDGSFVTQDEIPQTQQQGQDLSSSGGKIIEYSGDVSTNFEFVDASTNAVEFVAQPSASAEILLKTIVEQQPPASNSEDSVEKERPTKILKLKCKYCSKQFSKNFDLQQHLRSHTGEKPFQCVVCGRAFSQKSNVKKHMATHKVWPIGLNSTLPKDPLQPISKKDGASSDKDCGGNSTEVELMVDRGYVCQYCNTRFESYFELKTHMKQHSHQKVYKCIQKNCQQTFSDLETFVSHSRLHSTEVLYRCHVCRKQFHTLTDLGIHQYTHNTKSPPTKANTRFYRCIKCKSKFSSPEALDHHMTINTHSYPCPHCGKIFTCERYLRRHLPTHGTTQSFMCPQCGKGFRTEQYLNTHKLTHSTSRPFVCQHCPAAFNRKDRLVRHLLIHQSVKKFKCPFRVYLGCPKEFNRADKLKLHILTHSSVRPSLQCRICNKTFQRQSLLRQHDRTHHPTAPHKCQNCGVGFKKKVSLAAHNCKQSPEQQKDSTMQEDCTSKRSQPYHLQPARKGVRKSKPKGRSKRDITQVGSIANDNKTGDNVPTIEIIVMPVPVSLEQRSSSNETASTERGSMYHVLFPAESKIHTVFTSGDEAAMSQCSQPQDQEVPVVSTSL